MATQTLLRSETLREIEKTHAIDQPPLMERAGNAAAKLALKLQAGLSGPPLILAGPGNNGGDALVAARVLKACGLDPVVVFLGHADKLPIDARMAWERWSTAGNCRSDIPARSYGLVVDGLFGIGLARSLTEPWLSLIARINAYRGPVLAIDCPSGLNADTGTLNPVAVRATHTITFISHKPGLLTLDGPDHCGEVTVADIGLADEVNAQQTAGFINNPALFAASLLPRQRNTHKGTYGSAAIIGGAPTMAGAALLAGRAALMLGAGRVFIGMLERIAVDHGQPELMLKSPAEAMTLATAIGIGPGLAQSDEAANLLRRSIETVLPLVIDADALNLLAAHPVLARQIARRSAATLLTPHPAEAARLLGGSVETVQADRIASALELAQRFHACVVLKGCGSIIATPEGRWFINTTGNAGLATAGSGDVLTGFCVALLAQGWTVKAAALGATWLHGTAADRLVDDGEGSIGIAAGELIAPARRVFNRLCVTSA
ncbi:ADP-dependent (S)-NAD(P)H-hydrate dehydratase,NAD(P)H-hydrate epimerase [Georgfuchsia toluolica]|uniref:Bifunctional NAD(P)H-hydrate repair enzyme n=1 Tax=Georgfuchsia toluolica TaxID=424218 RepID=A0A916J109_9PROT|nr:NAD(P)H-hydrate dehydratase [Georgfuchsia toluolica]CAG4882720.1 ADP-dependent (S)-NAD(P)H-hydrate dehydratase,NAD(P)H-hydrate epimerase [Georgfuchsia toluolica]